MVWFGLFVCTMKGQRYLKFTPSQKHARSKWNRFIGPGSLMKHQSVCRNEKGMGGGHGGLGKVSLTLSFFKLAVRSSPSAGTGTL